MKEIQAEEEKEKKMNTLEKLKQKDQFFKAKALDSEIFKKKSRSRLKALKIDGESSLIEINEVDLSEDPPASRVGHRRS